MRQKLGQHFLYQRSILERIASAVCAHGEPLVIEIGPGKGALTAHLLARAQRVVAVEIDPMLVETLAAKFASEPRLSVICADALRADLAQWGPAVIAGNLPYYAATPILEKVVWLGPSIRQSTFLVQKEVAERVAAAPGQRAYGYLTVELHLFCESELLFEVKPGAFRPPPKVDSAVIRLRHRDRTPELGIANPAAFLRFVSRCFRQKRKTIRNNLAGFYPRASVDPLPEASARAEQLSLEQFARLYRRLVP